MHPYWVMKPITRFLRKIQIKIHDRGRMEINRVKLVIMPFILTSVYSLISID